MKSKRFFHRRKLRGPFWARHIVFMFQKHMNSVRFYAKRRAQERYKIIRLRKQREKRRAKRAL